jgi:hypothetical protein
MFLKTYKWEDQTTPVTLTPTLKTKRTTSLILQLHSVIWHQVTVTVTMMTKTMMSVMLMNGLQRLVVAAMAEVVVLVVVFVVRFIVELFVAELVAWSTW